MKTTKKVLSVFLSLLMVLTSISVAFVFTASADEDPLAVLAEALKSNTVKNLQYVSTGTGTSDTASTTTITLKTYEEYKEIASLLQKIDDAVKAGEVYKGHIDCIDSTQTCVHFGMLKDGLRDALVPSYLEEQDYIDYNVAALLSKVFYMPRAAYTHGGYTSDGITYPGNNSSSSKVKASITNTVSVKTDDYAGYIADKGSYENSIDVVLSTTYTLTMKSINYQTGSFIKTNHYHNAIDTSKPPVVASVVDTDRTNTLKGFNSYLEAIDYPYYTMDVLFAMQKNGELDGENGKYTEWLNKYAEIKGVVSEDLFPTFFAKSQDFLDLLKKCASAAKLEWFEEQAEGWVTWAAAHPDYGTFNYPKFDSLHDEGTLESDYQEFIVYYNEIFENGTQDMLDYLEANYPGFSQSYYVNFTDNVKAYVLRDYKEIADNVFELYNNTHGDLSEDEQVTAYSQVVTVLNTIKEYSDTVINAIIGRDYYNAIVELEQALYTDINQYVRFFVKNTAETLATASTQEMMDAVRAIPENLSGLRAFYDELSASAGQERADVLLGSILQKAETLEEVVLSYLSTRFSEEVLEAERMWIEVANREAIIWNFEVYFKLRSAFNNLEDNILSWLYEIGRDDVVSQEIKDLYDEINRIVYAGYKEFRDSFGFNAFQQTELPYESRYPYDNDVVKTEPYEVTEQKLLDTIKKLDAFLTSDEFNQLVGLEGDLGSTLTGLLEGVIYTDSFINTVVNLLYPLVLGEFAKVFSDLPTEVETDLELMGSKQHLNVKVAYAKLLYEVLEETNLNLTPELLSASLPDTYEAAKTALAKARRDWTNSNIFENGSLTLDWGVNAAFADESLTDDEKVEYFYQAAAAALSGLKPLLMALLANTPWNSSVESIATGKTTVKVLVTVDVTVDVVLNLKATANNGYVNALGPVFEALGIENIPEAATLTAYGAAGDTASVVKAIFEPIFDFVQNVGEQPIDTVLGILPNLVYALSFNMVPNILSMLKTEIAYDADANYNAIGFVTGTVDDVLADSVKIDVGTMLNLESMGLDLSNGLAGIISLLGVDIPALDEATISTLGKLITKTGTVRNEWIYDNSEIGNDSYYTVEADKADVAYYILTYVGDILKDKEALTNLLSAFLDEEKIGTVTNILNVLDINDTGDVIAALVEILNAEPYPEAQFSYENFRGTDGSSIAEIKNAAYTLYWKEWHAKYVGEHLTSLVENVLKLIGNYGEEIDVGAELTKLINSLFTNANMEALTGLVSGLLDGLDESVMNIISTVDPLINFDISAILDAVKNPEIPEFEDGDRDGFINALVAYVTPLVPVLKVLLVGGDNVITVADDLATIYGADGYESGVIPVLEAIGCDPATIVSYDEFAALEGEDAVYAVLNPILTLVDSILDSEVGDMLNKLLGLLPNILYFIESDGLNQAVKNILRPVYVVLDEIRPIKDIELSINLNLNDILAGLLDNVSVSLGGITIVLPSFDELSDLLLSIGTVSTYTSATGAEAKKLSVDNAFTPELVTYILRLLVGAILFENNTNAAIRWVQQRDILSDGQKTDLINIIKALSKLSTDQAMFILFNIFFGANLAFEGVENATNTADYIESLLQSISDNFENGIESQYESLVSALEAIAKSSSEQFQNFVDRAEETIASIKEGAQNFRDNVSNQAGQAANGVQNSLLNFINGIKDFFQRLANIFRNLFSNLTK